MWWVVAGDVVILCFVKETRLTKYFTKKKMMDVNVDFELMVSDMHMFEGCVAYSTPML